MISKKLRITTIGVLLGILFSIIIIGCLALNSIITWEWFLIGLSIIADIGAVILVILVLIILYFIERGK